MVLTWCILLLLIVFDFTISKLSIDRISKCVKETLLDKRYRKTKDETFAMHYGEPSVEIFNTLTTSDMKKVMHLCDCARREDPTLFHGINIKEKESHDFFYGGSNVTYLTGIFQAVMPDVIDKLKHAVDIGAKEAHWPQRISNLGIRSVQIISYDGEKIDKSQLEIDRAARKKASERRSFSIAPHKPEDYVEPVVLDPDSDEALDKHIGSRMGSVFTAMVLLNDRQDFLGGEILIEKTRASRHGKQKNDDTAPADDDNDADDNSDSFFYDDEEEMEEQRARERTAGRNKKSYKYNAATSNLARCTPEKGGMILVQSSHRHGTQPITRGERLVLEMEFWPYADGVAGAHRPEIEDAQPLVPLDRSEL